MSNSVGWYGVLFVGAIALAFFIILCTPGCAMFQSMTAAGNAATAGDTEMQCRASCGNETQIFRWTNCGVQLMGALPVGSDVLVQGFDIVGAHNACQRICQAMADSIFIDYGCLGDADHCGDVAACLGVQF